MATEGFGVYNTNFDRLWQLTLLTSLCHLIAIPMLSLVPKTLDFSEGDEPRSKAAGVFTICVFLGGLAWAIQNIVANFG